MTTIDASPLSDTLQALVDARLDTIDRMLIGRMNRQDRLAIVREVESQVFDLLARHEGSPIDRDDVLAVLARLDPPEAYLADDDSTAAGRPPRSSAIPRSIAPSHPAESSRLDLASGILGMVAMATLMLAVLVTIMLSADEVILLGAAGLAFVPGLLAVIFAVKVRLRRAWAIVGLVTGLIALLGFLATGVLLLTMLL